MKSNIFLLLAMFKCANQQKIEGRTRLQKLVCILKHRYNIPFSYSFKPYYYGPYSDEITDTVETLVGLGLLTKKKEAFAPGIVKYTYELTAQVDEAIRGASKRVDLNELEMRMRELEGKSTEELVLESKRVSNLYS